MIFAEVADLLMSLVTDYGGVAVASRSAIGFNSDDGHIDAATRSSQPGVAG